MILVTGATGHLGNVLVRELSAQGQPVRALVLPGEPLTALEGLPVELITGDILDTSSLEFACRGVDTIFHLASLVSIVDDYAPALHRVNVEGTLNVIEAARKAGVRRLVYTSSIHALARPELGRVIDETLPFDPLNPAGAYDRSKAEASLQVLQAAQTGLDAVIVCPTGVVGPHDYRRSEMGEMILSWMGQKINFMIEGFFDFVDVRDVALGHIAAMQYGRRGETYILGGERIRVNHMCELVKKVTGSRAPSLTLPTGLAMTAARAAEIYYRLTHTRPRFTRYSIETLLSNSNISSGKAKQELGYAPRSLSDTLNDTVAWWLANRHLIKATVRI